MSPPPPPMRRQCAGRAASGANTSHARGENTPMLRLGPDAGNTGFGTVALRCVGSNLVVSTDKKFRDCLKWRSLNLFQTRWKHPLPTSRTSAGFATNLALGQGCSNAADGGNRDERLISAARPSGLLADTQKPILHPAPWGLHSLLLLPENGAE